MSPSRRVSLSLAAALALAATSLASAQGIETPRVPVRTAMKEINTLRAEYADGMNKKAVASLTAMYLNDAVVIGADGSTHTGREAIGRLLAEQSKGWGTVTISSDTVRVFGNTAWDVGMSSNTGADGKASTSRYLVILRRGVTRWQVASLAVVPVVQVTATK